MLCSFPKIHCRFFHSDIIIAIRHNIAQGADVCLLFAFYIKVSCVLISTSRFTITKFTFASWKWFRVCVCACVRTQERKRALSFKSRTLPRKRRKWAFDRQQVVTAYGNNSYIIKAECINPQQAQLIAAPTAPTTTTTTTPSKTAYNNIEWESISLSMRFWCVQLYRQNVLRSRHSFSRHTNDSKIWIKLLIEPQIRCEMRRVRREVYCDRRANLFTLYHIRRFIFSRHCIAWSTHRHTSSVSRLTATALYRGYVVDVVFMLLLLLLSLLLLLFIVDNISSVVIAVTIIA